MSEIVLEFVVTGGNGYDNTAIGRGESLMMVATTETSIRDCAKFLCKRFAPPNLSAAANVRVCMLLGDFGPQYIRVKGDEQLDESQSSNDCSVADYLCHSSPIMIRLDTLDDSSQIFVRTLKGASVTLNVSMDDTVRHVKQLLRAKNDGPNIFNHDYSLFVRWQATPSERWRLEFERLWYLQECHAAPCESTPRRKRTR
jgi:hypothetical protein